MERCPNCRARFKEAGQKACQRCGMQLAGLWALETAVDQLDTLAASMMLTDDMRQAAILLERRLQLKQSEFVGKLLAFASAQAKVQQQHQHIKQDVFVQQLLALTSEYLEQIQPSAVMTSF